MVITLAACGAREPLLTYEDGVVRAAGWTGPEPADGWQSVLAVRASESPDTPPMLGDYEERGGVITFTPRFPPSPGVALNVSFKPGGKPELTATFSEPAKALAPTTRVAHLYPSADMWPENTLKLYLEFSAPMAAGEAWTHLRVLDEQGRVIGGPFVEVEQELWDPSGKRLTVLFDPGRLKRGLVDNETSGPPLMSGRTVTIEVDPSWRDASGAPLAEGFKRTIQVSDPVRRPIEPKAWRIDPPKSDGDTLVVAFDRPLDHALASRAISVMRDGSLLAGDIALEDQEMRLRFTPVSPWAEGRYEILVDGVLEDLAGNRPGKIFDVDISAGQSTTAVPSTAIEFLFPPR